MADIRKVAEELINGTSNELEHLQEWYGITPYKSGHELRIERRKEERYLKYKKKKK